MKPFAVHRAIAACLASISLAAAAANEGVLDLDEAAELLRVKREVIEAMAQSKQIPARRVGEAWRFSRVALLEWLRGQPSSATSAEPSAPSAAVGEKRVTPTAAEIALRDQRILLAPGKATVDLGLAYARTEQSLFPILRVEQRTAGVTGAIRYGLRDDLQLTARIPAVWRRDTTYADASTGAAASRSSRDDFLGDATLSVAGVGLREAVGRPNVIWSVDAVAPVGAKDRGLGAGVVVAKSYDPAVVFAGLSYLRGFSVDAADPRRSLAKNNFGVSFGYTYAINDALALSTILTGNYRASRAPDPGSIAPSRERYQLQLGMTWMLGRGVFMEPGVGLRLGGSSPDLTLLMNLSWVL
jgi:excisionase family DNA binding protein